MLFIRVTALVFTFLLRLKFPSNVSIVHVISKRYGSDTLALFRKCEKLFLRKCKLISDIDFLIQCRANNVIPKFLHFQTSNRYLRNSAAYIKAQERFLNTEIKRHQSDLRQIVKQFKFHTQSLQNGVSNLDFVHLISVIERCSAKQVQNWNNTHSRKLHNLLLKNNCSVLDSDRVIFNFTNTQLTDAEKSLLTKGLNFCIPLSSLKYDDFLVPFEKLNRLLSKEPIWSANPDSRYVFKSNFKDLAISSFYSFNPKHIPQNLTNAEIAAFRNLRKRKDIIIVKPDKGNGVVILPREEYTSKMETILSDTSKFQRIGNIKNCLNHTLSLEQKVRKFLTDLFKQNVIDKETHENLRPTGTAPGVLYGLPKVHKANHPLRPILSAINTVGYNISKFLVPILGCLTVNDYTVRDTFSF